MYVMKRLRVHLLALLGALCIVGLVSPAQAAGVGCLPASLKQKLNEVRAKFGPVRVISSHRPGARIAGSGKRSYHASCRAVDFHPPKGKYRQVAAYLKSTHSGGVGTYACGMNHIHLDNGPRVRFHTCAGSGRSFVQRRSGKKYVAKRGGNRTYAKRGSGRTYASRGASKKRYSSAAKTRRAASEATQAKRSRNDVYAERSN